MNKVVASISAAVAAATVLVVTNLTTPPNLSPVSVDAPADVWETNRLTLTWSSSTGQGIAGYFLYYGALDGVWTNRTELIKGTNYTFTFVDFGGLNKRRYFAATAVDLNGLESPYSESAVYPPKPKELVAILLNCRGVTEQSSDLKRWTPFTNLIGVARAPVIGGLHLFRSVGITNRLTYQLEWFQPK